MANVPATKWNAFKSAQLTDNVIVYGILPHEHQMSVMNVVLKRIPDSEVPIKSKERLIIQCGYRRFVVNPIFSQHTNGDKHKVISYYVVNPNIFLLIMFYFSLNVILDLIPPCVPRFTPPYNFLLPPY